jgi:putative membrane protein
MRRYETMGVCYGGLGWGGMGLIGPILSVVLFAGVLGVLGLGAVWAIRQLGRGERATSPPRPGGEPLEIAQRRLAAGEITTEEFEEIRERLRD